MISHVADTESASSVANTNVCLRGIDVCPGNIDSRLTPKLHIYLPMVRSTTSPISAKYSSRF